MRETLNDKIHSERTFLGVLGLTGLTLLILGGVAGAEPSSNITFVTTGSSFSPIIAVTGAPSIEWTFGDGSTSNSASPTVNFGSAGTRSNTLVVTPWSAVTKINVGYDASDGGITPGPNTIASLKQQNVIAVSGLENVAPSLQVWASSNNPITSLDFSNFTALHTIECFHCRFLATLELRNVPSLNRLCYEQSNISYIDLSEAPSLADIRGSSQRSQTYTVNWGTTGDNLWHICIRDNPHMKSTFLFNQFPILRDLFNWNDNQGGTLQVTSTSLKNVLSSNNHYSAAILSGCFPAGRYGVVEIQNNNLKSLDISNDPGLVYLNASFNSLNQTAVDGILQTLDSYTINGGHLDLTGNAAPSVIGISHANNLTTRRWTVRISSGNNFPIANFTNSVTSGIVPLVVQFNDTSANNPTSWLWDFGDETYSTEKFPKHNYLSPGNYTVTLSARNSNGFDFKIITINVLAKPVLPVPNFSSSVNEGYIPLSVQFTDLSENATEWSWDFGDGTNSTEMNPSHIYSVAGNYSVNHTVSNANGTASKMVTITVFSSSNLSSDGSSSGSSSGSGSGGSSSGGSGSGGSGSGGSGSGGSAGGSPEPQGNVEAKELSQTYVTSGKAIKFEFPRNVTPVVYVSFDSKKTAGKTTTIVEMLKGKSTLVSGLPTDEIYKHLNIWVGNSGFASSKNVENAVVCFKVEKAWVEDKKIDKFSITLNRYNDKKWDRLPTNLLSEDNNCLYLTAPTPGFSPFAITGKPTASVTGIQSTNGNKTQSIENDAQIKPNTGNETANIEETDKKAQGSNTSGKGSAKAPSFEISSGIISLLCMFLYKRK
jgi:PGF-pre-PGF domain-containing protein